jgi:hypothetical protein
MVGHQTVRPYLDSCFTSLLGEQIVINVVVPVLEKYSLPLAPALGHMMRKAGNHHAGKARHLGKLPTKERKGDRYHVDAYPTGLIARAAFMPSLTGLGILSFPFPGTAVPGYRLFRPRSTSSGQALRDWLSPVGHRAILPSTQLVRGMPQLIV